MVNLLTIPLLQFTMSSHSHCLSVGPCLVSTNLLLSSTPRPVIFIKHLFSVTLLLKISWEVFSPHKIKFISHSMMSKAIHSLTFAFSISSTTFSPLWLVQKSDWCTYSFPSISCCLMLLCPCRMLSSVNNGRYPFVCRLNSSFWNHFKCCLFWEVFFVLLSRVKQFPFLLP